MSAMSLKAYAIGLVAFMLIKVLAPGYFARQDTKTPVRIAIKAMVANMVFNLMLVFQFQHAGLAMATTLSAYLNAGLLFFGLTRTHIYQPDKGWWLYGARLILANAAMAAVLVWLVADMHLWLDWSLLERAKETTILVCAGAAVYSITLLLVGVRPRHFRH